MLRTLESLGSHNQQCGLGPEGGEGLTPPPPFRGFIQESHARSLGAVRSVGSGGRGKTEKLVWSTLDHLASQYFIMHT